MNTDLDVNKIASEVILGTVKSVFERMTEGFKSTSKSMYNKIFDNYGTYMERTYRKNIKVRILCQKEKDVDFDSISVKSYFAMGGKIYSADDLVTHVFEKQNLIIRGDGGAGKTFFMRYLWLTLFRSGLPISPVFLELRQFNEINEINISNFIRNTISGTDGMSEELFNYCCTNGRFCFILDGFDEIEDEKRDAIQAQIVEFANNFPLCSLVISSRYGKHFLGWHGFYTFQALPFELEQVRELIEKVPFHADSKRLFLSKLDDVFFAEHRSFLSNPLLSIIMLMTFRENMDIPRRLINFYDQAFNTLFTWHDATKLYIRKKCMDISDFQKSFSNFCLVSYLNEDYEFTRSQIIHYIERSNRMSGITLDPERILLDYEESVNMIRLDGLNYIFVHRSFQEYFTAWALVKMPINKFKAFLPRIKVRYGDNVMLMCYEFNKDLLIDSYISDEFTVFKNNFSPKIIENDFITAESIDLSYTFYLILRKNSEGGRTARISINMDDNFSGFLDNIERLKSRNTNERTPFSQDITFDSFLFSVFDNVAMEGAPRDLTATLKFKSGRPHLSFASEEVAQFDLSFYPEMKQRVADYLDEFRTIERKLQRAVQDAVSWCEGELQDSNARGMSLDEILEHLPTDEPSINGG